MGIAERVIARKLDSQILRQPNNPARYSRSAWVLLGVEQKQIEKGQATPLNYVSWPECMGGCAALQAFKDVKSRLTPILVCRVQVRGEYVLNSLGLPFCFKSHQLTVSSLFLLFFRVHLKTQYRAHPYHQG